MGYLSLLVGIDVGTAIRIGVFVVFFSVAAVAIYHNRNATARRGFVALFFLFLLVPGLTGLSTWPFFPWQLYDDSGPTETTFYEMRVVDADGKEIRYDTRASPPIVGSISRRYARNMAGVGWAAYTDREARTQGCYFLERAIRYRERGLTPDHPSFVPRHQWDLEWTREDLERYSEFTALRVYRVDVHVAEEGDRLRSVTDSRVLEVNRSTCS